MDKKLGIKLFWTGPANRQVKEIFDYYRYVAGVKTAQKIVDKIHSSAARLAYAPQTGQFEPFLDDRTKGYRRLIEGNYKIVYYIEEDTVRISAVFACRRDPMALRENVEKRESVPTNI